MENQNTEKDMCVRKAINILQNISVPIILEDQITIPIKSAIGYLFMYNKLSGEEKRQKQEAVLERVEPPATEEVVLELVETPATEEVKEDQNGTEANT